MKIILLGLLAVFSCSLFAQDAVDNRRTERLLRQSIKFHDPTGSWSTFHDTLFIAEPRTENPNRISTVIFNQGRDLFRLERMYGKDEIVFELELDACHWYVNGRGDLGEDELKKRRLNCSRNRNYANFYRFLYGMPMEIMDRGYKLIDGPVAVELKGQKLIKLELDIEGAPFANLWNVYFDPETGEVKAYEYFPEETDAQNNIMYLEGVVEKSGIKFPLERKWYEGQEYKGVDTVK
ncbi:MAG: DUF6503 family protein [Bacteroidota bacterium]